jgi:dCMP deaminase
MRDRPSKNLLFMRLAHAVSDGSPDPKTQVGAVLVDSKNRVISTGYNGPPAGFPDYEVDWTDRESVYPVIIHAEVNAILYSAAKINHHCKLFVTLSPCKECLKLVAASGIKTVYYLNRYKDFDITAPLSYKFGIQLIQQGM